MKMSLILSSLVVTHLGTENLTLEIFALPGEQFPEQKLSIAVNAVLTVGNSAEPVYRVRDRNLSPLS